MTSIDEAIDSLAAQARPNTWDRSWKDRTRWRTR